MGTTHFVLKNNNGKVWFHLVIEFPAADGPDSIDNRVNAAAQPVGRFVGIFVIVGDKVRLTIPV